MPVESFLNKHHNIMKMNFLQGSAAHVAGAGSACTPASRCCRHKATLTRITDTPGKCLGPSLPLSVGGRGFLPVKESGREREREGETLWQRENEREEDEEGRGREDRRSRK